MTRAHIFISGFVQGVGFRQFVKKEAIRLGLTGWVKNTSNGRVEALVEGSEEKIKEMIRLCKKGPFLAEVEDVQTEWEETDENYSYFEVRN